MLTKQDIDGLPDDPVDAFAAIADLFEAFVEDRQGDREGIATGEAVRAAEDVLAVIAALGVQDDYPRLQRGIPVENNPEDFWSWWADFRGAVRYYRTHALMVRRKSPLSVVLDSSHRSKIRALLSRVRDIVPQLKVSQSKQEKIIDLISRLENEVDRPRTRLESFLGLMLQGGSVAKQLGDDAKPLIEDIERIKNVLADAKEEDLPTPSLPPSKPTPRIKDQRPPARKAELDDDIPF
jgi:hypothetical protein